MAKRRAVNLDSDLEFKGDELTFPEIPDVPISTMTLRSRPTDKDEAKARAKAHVVLARRFNRACGNIRRKSDFDENGGCVPGTIRSWRDGTQTYLKVPGGESRTAADPSVRFTRDSGFKMNQHGILRASDNTVINYKKINQMPPHDLNFDCPSAVDCDHLTANVLIGRPSVTGNPKIRYFDTSNEDARAAFDGLKYPEDTSFATVSRADAMAKAKEQTRKKREEMRQQRLDEEELP